MPNSARHSSSVVRNISSLREMYRSASYGDLMSDEDLLPAAAFSDEPPLEVRRDCYFLVYLVELAMGDVDRHPAGHRPENGDS